MTKARDIANLGDSLINDADDNVALGDGALDSQTTGANNVAIGESALASVTTASDNTAIGYQAATATTGGENTAIGKRAMYSNTSGQFNSSLGLAALFANTTGNYNTALGNAALGSNTTASNNTAVGYKAGYGTTTGNQNTYIGYQAGRDTSVGVKNTAVGYNAGLSASGGGNTALGQETMLNVTTGDENTFLGLQAGRTATTGSQNTFVGAYSGYYVTTGQKNTILGKYTGNQGGLDIRTSSNNIVLSDGDGNPRMFWHGGNTYPYWDIRTDTNFQNIAIFRHLGTTPYGPAIGFTNAAPNNTSVYFLQCNDSSADRMRIYSNGNVVNVNNSYGALSDERLKENIVDSGSQWDDIKALTVRKYSMKADNLDAPNMLGVIAQEVEAAGMGGLVFESPDIDPETKEDLGTVTKQINYSILYMKAVKALQEAMDRIETLETENTAIKARLDALESA